MAETNWLQLAVALIGGGAAGALITAVVSAYRTRPQPVGKRVDVLPVFRPAGNPAQLEAAIAVTHAGKTVTFKNLFLAEVQVLNKGNRDLEELKFGVTLGESDRCIFVETTSPDRHHNVNLARSVTPETPQQEIDFVLNPFNRGDSYVFKLYLVIPEGKSEPNALTLGSASPIRFVAMPTVGEMLARAAYEVVVDIGPLSIGLGR